MELKRYQHKLNQIFPWNHQNTVICNSPASGLKTNLKKLSMHPTLFRNFYR